jgi:hypothetical protein
VCPQCGLDYDTISPSDAVVALRSYPRRYREALGDVTDPARERLLRRKPDDRTWSALEYTAHVRDVIAAMNAAFVRMLREDNPKMLGDEVPDPDELAARERYNEQDPAEVLSGLDAAANAAADTLAGASPDDWTRPGTFPWGERDLLTMARNAVHEGYHHLRDIDDVLQRVR